MAKDYYETLGVPKNSSKEDIKKAYKRLAKQFHPDLNKAAGATDKFKEINEAASVLGDDSKRAQYDKFGTATEGFGAGPSGFDFSDSSSFDFDDIFESFFGGGGRRRQSSRGSDLTTDVEISLFEAAKGIKKTLKIPRQKTCKNCSGSGADSASDIITCPQCKGAGVSENMRRTPFGMFVTRTTCTKCGGVGKSIKKECHECRGKGTISDVQTIEINIPAGIDEGQQLRVTGAGEARKNAAAGDLYVRVIITQHDLFQRRGSDIYIEATIPFAIATLGGEIDVPTLDGNASLKIPSGTSANTVFRMRDKGLPEMNSSSRGSEYIRVQIEVPNKLSKKQKELLEEFQKQGPSKGIFSKVKHWFDEEE